jgi:hypothetical protein
MAEEPMSIPKTLTSFLNKDEKKDMVTLYIEKTIYGKITIPYLRYMLKV